MGGMTYSEVRDWQENGRKRNTVENINAILQGVIDAKKAQQEQATLDRANAATDASLRQSGYVRQAPQSQGVLSWLMNAVGGERPTYQYDQSQDRSYQRSILDDYYKQSQIANNMQDIQKSKWEQSPEGRAAKSRESVGRQNAKDKRVEELFDTFETNKVKRQQIADAEEAAGRITQGLSGTVLRGLQSKFFPNSQQLADWQKIKMVLTDAQLMNTAKTKGAISDREMALFADAAANDDIASVQKMTPVFEKLLASLDADEQAKIKGFQRMYGENPMEWQEMQEYLSSNQQQGGNVSSGVPDWANGYESQYAEARKRGISDKEIKAFLNGL